MSSPSAMTPMSQPAATGMAEYRAPGRGCFLHAGSREHRWIGGRRSSNSGHYRTMANGTMRTQEEAVMERISEIERPGLAVRAFYKIGERMFGAVPTPERILAHRIP